MAETINTMADDFARILATAKPLGLKHSRYEPLRVIANAIPAGLKAQPRWLLWKLELRDGKLDKIPYNPRTDNKATGENFRDAWAAYDHVIEAYHRGGYAGIGFAFDGSDRIVGIDLDDCRRKDGSLEPWACDVLDRLRGYVEVSPSGTGVKVYVFADITFDSGRNGKDFGPLELYRAGRWFAITGHHLAAR